MRAERGVGFDEKQPLRLASVRENWKFFFHFFFSKKSQYKIEGKYFELFFSCYVRIGKQTGRLSGLVMPYPKIHKA